MTVVFSVYRYQLYSNREWLGIKFGNRMTVLSWNDLVSNPADSYPWFVAGSDPTWLRAERCRLWAPGRGRAASRSPASRRAPQAVVARRQAQVMIRAMLSPGRLASRDCVKMTLGLLTLAALFIIRWDNRSLIYQLLIEIMACKNWIKLIRGLESDPYGDSECSSTVA